MNVILLEQKKSNLTQYGNPVYVYKYDLKKLYRLNRIQQAITLKLNKIPDHDNKIYLINIKFIGMASAQGWMLTSWLTYVEAKSIQNSYQFIIDSSPEIELRARYFEIYICNKP